MEHQPLGRVMVVGVGDAGSAALDRIIGEGVNRLHLVAVNTYTGALAKSKAETRLLIGEHSTRGLGAGGSPDLGRKAAEESAESLFRLPGGASTVFVLAGFGGGTGTGAAPVIAGIARELDIKVTAYVSQPFVFEGSHRRQIAQRGVEVMHRLTTTLTVIHSDHLLELMAKPPSLETAFSLSIGALAWGVISHFV